MILPIMINTTIPTSYKGIKKRLQELGLQPTGKPQQDKDRLISAINELKEEYKVEKNQKKKIEEEKIIQQQQENKENNLGAQLLGEQNRLFFGI